MKEKPHYVNNREFSDAVVSYVDKTLRSKEKGENPPVVPDYIGGCFLKIAEGLSHKSNFLRYTYREEMVMDAVENCLKAIYNYNIEAATRTGNPNAFAYFTQICYYAFLRRIAKEKKQQDIKLRFIERSGLEQFIDMEENGDDTERAFVDQLRVRIDRVREADKQLRDFAASEKISPLEDLISEYEEEDEDSYSE